MAALGQRILLEHPSALMLGSNNHSEPSEQLSRGIPVQVLPAATPGVALNEL